MHVMGNYLIYSVVGKTSRMIRHSPARRNVQPRALARLARTLNYLFYGTYGTI
jgi:hypothetical protein